MGLRDADEDRAGASSREPRGAVCCATGTESFDAQTRNRRRVDKCYVLISRLLRLLESNIVKAAKHRTDYLLSATVC